MKSLSLLLATLLMLAAPLVVQAQGADVFTPMGLGVVTRKATLRQQAAGTGLRELPTGTGLRLGGLLRVPAGLGTRDAVWVCVAGSADCGFLWSEEVLVTAGELTMLSRSPNSPQAPRSAVVTATPAPLAAPVVPRQTAMPQLPTPIPAAPPAPPADLSGLRIGGYDAQIRQAATEIGLDPLALAILVQVESGGRAGAVSPSGALGLTQVMPLTGASISAQTGLPCDAASLLQPMTNLRCGAWYFVQCLRQAGAVWSQGREAPALGAAGAGYNAGPGYIAQIVAYVQRGGEVCGFPQLTPVAGDKRSMAAVTAQARSWCRQMVTAWRATGRN